MASYPQAGAAWGRGFPQVLLYELIGSHVLKDRVRVGRLAPTEGLVRGVERRWERSLQVATAGDQGISGFASSRVGPSVASGWRLAVCKHGLVVVSFDASYFRPRNEESVSDERCVAIRVSIFLTTGGSFGVLVLLKAGATRSKPGVWRPGGG